MNARRLSDRHAGTGNNDRGFTLVELLIAIVLSLMIGGVVVTALITSLNAARTTTAQMSDSTDAGLISSFLIRDAQSAGGINPEAAARDDTLGVSNNKSDPDGLLCTPGPSEVKVRFGWKDRSFVVIDAKQVLKEAKVIVTYATATVTDSAGVSKVQLIRRVCTYVGTTVTQAEVVLGANILDANATCQPGGTTCSGQPKSITLTVTGKDTPRPLVSILTASLRTAASQLTIIGPSLTDGEFGAPYPFIYMTTIGAVGTTAWSATGLPAGLSISPGGIVSGTPTVWGHFTVKLTVSDELSATATATYPVFIHAPPVANADQGDLNEDSTLSVAAPGVLGNDTSPEGNPLTAILYSGVANGALTFTSNGAYTYSPRLNFNGTDSFKYKVSDGSASSNTVTVTLRVAAVNDAPVNRVPVAQETPMNTNEVLANSSIISVSDVDAAETANSQVKVTLTATNGTVTLTTKTGLSFSTGDGTADPVMTFTGTIANVNLDLAGLTFLPTSNFTGAASLRIDTSDQGYTGPAGPLVPLIDTDTVSINVTSLGIFTANQDVGNVKLAGSSTYSSPTYSVKGSGKDIWENNFDGFQFLYRPMTGDGSLTARIVSEDVTYNGAHNSTLMCWAADNSHQQPCISVSKAEVMFRAQDLISPSAVHASVGMTQGNGSEYIYRTTTGVSTGAASPGDSLDAPYWVRLTRRGDQFTAEISPDGMNWAQRGNAQTITMGTTINVGLAASAVYQLDTTTNQSKKLNSVSFDNVSISTPPTAVPDTYFVSEDATLTVPAISGVLFNDSDPEGDILNAQVVTGTAGLTLNGDGSFTYAPPANFSGTASFIYVANDGLLNSAPITVALTVNPANEAPSFVKGADQRIVSNLGAQVIAGWATAISQGTGESDQLFDFVVTNTNNPLFASQPAIGADGTLTYASAADATGTATVSVAIHDNGGTANGGVDTSAVQTFTITIDDPPVVAATATSMVYTENATLPLDPGIVVTDSDSANLVSATVTMTTNYVNGQDTLAFVDQNGIVGTWTPATGVLALSGSSTVANYQTALRSITYTINSDNPNTATRTVTFVANDGILVSNTASRTITVTAISDAPVVTATGSSLSYTENGTPQLDPGITVADADSTNLSSVTVDMTTGYVNGEDTLAFVNQNGITGTWTPSTGVLLLSGNTTVANYQTALRSITYNDNTHAPNTSNRTVTFVANDGGLDSNTASLTITVTAVNDAPVNSVPGNQVTPRNTAEVFSAGTGNLISISDPDAGSAAVQVRLVSSNGTSTLSGVNGLTFKSGDSGTADADMTFTGSITDVNLALAGLSFNPTANFTGTATLQIVTNDQGNTGSGVAGSDTDSISIAVAYAPVVTLSSGTTLSYTENGTPPKIDGSITVVDTDSANLASATVTISSGFVSGQDFLNFTNKTGVTGSWNASTGVLTFSGSGTKANWQSALRSVTFNTGNNPTSAMRTVTIVVNDGQLDSNIVSRSINVTPANDAPVNMVPATQTVVHSTSRTLTFSISDPDVGSGDVEVQLVSVKGTTTLSGVAGLTFSIGGNGQATMTFTGTLTDVNQALSGLKFNAGSSAGAGSLKIVTSDLGNSGGTAKTDTDTVTINIT